MLILSRKQDESITIGDNIRIVVRRVNKGDVRLAIDAPRDVPIRRSELPPEHRKRKESAA